MKISKAWDWSKNDEDIWIQPSEESYYLVNRWKSKGYKKFLDLGCGLGRHSIIFAKSGFSVASFDLSSEAINYLKEWTKNENLSISTYTGDMIELPFENNFFDCLLAYHVISHSDTLGVKKIINEIYRVLKCGGEFYLTLCSKNSPQFQKEGSLYIDENTMLKEEVGPEMGVPHFYADLNLIHVLFEEFKLIRIRHIQDFKVVNQESSWHFFIHGQKRMENT